MNHPPVYTYGTRVLMLCSRNKDSVTTKKRSIFRVSHNSDEFDDALAELCALKAPRERVYASLNASCLRKATRLFKQRQLDADYDKFPLDFYHRLQDKWVSCLRAPTSQETHLWMFDCDSLEDHRELAEELKVIGVRIVHMYPTKTGVHLITNSFNKSLLSNKSAAMLHVNGMMLWNY